MAGPSNLAPSSVGRPPLASGAANRRMHGPSEAPRSVPGGSGSEPPALVTPGNSVVGGSEVTGGRSGGARISLAGCARSPVAAAPVTSGSSAVAGLEISGGRGGGGGGARRSSAAFPVSESSVAADFEALRLGAVRDRDSPAAGAAARPGAAEVLRGSALGPAVEAEPLAPAAAPDVPLGGGAGLPAAWEARGMGVALPGGLAAVAASERVRGRFMCPVSQVWEPNVEYCPFFTLTLPTAHQTKG